MRYVGRCELKLRLPCGQRALKLLQIKRLLLPELLCAMQKEPPLAERLAKGHVSVGNKYQRLSPKPWPELKDCDTVRKLSKARRVGVRCDVSNVK